MTMSTPIAENGGPATVVDRFGGCPVCGLNDGLINIRLGVPIAPGISPPLAVAVCNTHRVWWPVGINRLPPDSADSEKRWVENAATLRSRYREVDALPPGSAIPTTHA
jgi:hypothetical protein